MSIIQALDRFAVEMEGEMVGGMPVVEITLSSATYRRLLESMALSMRYTDRDLSLLAAGHGANLRFRDIRIVEAKE